MLHPHRFVSISVAPSCQSSIKPVTAGQPGTVRVAVLGSDNFDVSQIDPSSLKLHGANALNSMTQDVNGDGKPDLVATFDTSAPKLHPYATVACLTGWLKNDQSFSGEDEIRVVPSLAGEDSQLPMKCLTSGIALRLILWPVSHLCSKIEAC